MRAATKRWQSSCITPNHLVMACVLVCSALWSVPARAFRTASDLVSFADSERVRWPRDSISYEIYERVPSELALVDVEQTVRSAFGLWTGLECGGPHFVYRGNTPIRAVPGDGINTIEWVQSGWLAMGHPDSAAAFTDVQYKRAAGGWWEIVEADVYINAEQFGWVLEGNSAASGMRDVRSVLTHEAGHMIGLLHPCEVGGADGAPECTTDASFTQVMMYPEYDPSRTALSTDDSAGACFLYPGASCEETGCTNGATCTPAGCILLCGSETCESGEICSSAGCVRPNPDDPGRAPPCATAAECDPGKRCLSGFCRNGDRPPGDACSVPGECASGACSDGVCARACGSDGDCLEGQHCEPSGVCSGAGGPLGSPCESGADCLGDQCLAGAKPAPVCTRLCGEGNPDCPANWVCSSVEGRAVCTPYNFAATGGGGCRASPSAVLPERATTACILLCLPALAILRTLRGRRSVRRPYVSRNRAS